VFRFDKVLCACGHYLNKSQIPLTQSILAQNCANLYIMAAQYLFKLAHHYHQAITSSHSEDDIVSVILIAIMWVYKFI